MKSPNKCMRVFVLTFTTSSCLVFLTVMFALDHCRTTDVTDIVHGNRPIEKLSVIESAQDTHGTKPVVLKTSIVSEQVVTPKSDSTRNPTVDNRDSFLKSVDALTDRVHNLETAFAKYVSKNKMSGSKISSNDTDSLELTKVELVTDSVESSVSVDNLFAN